MVNFNKKYEKMDSKKELLGHRKRLRERFLKGNSENFADYELLELLLTYAIPVKDVKPIAKALLKKFGSLASIFDEDINKLIECEGIGGYSAILLKLVKDIKIRYSSEQIKSRKQLSSAKLALEFISTILSGSPEEKFMVILLDTKNRVIDYKILFEGSINQMTVYPRKIAEYAIVNKAVSLIIAHNHPSGDTQPSKEDVNITHKIKEACALFDIHLLDHIIAGKGEYYSFNDFGLI